MTTLRWLIRFLLFFRRSERPSSLQTFGAFVVLQIFNNILRRIYEESSKLVHQGEPIWKMAVFLTKNGHFCLYSKRGRFQLLRTTWTEVALNEANTWRPVCNARLSKDWLVMAATREKPQSRYTLVNNPS